MINKCVIDVDLYRLLPFLLRLLFEKLLYQIFLKSIHRSQRFLYYTHRPNDFSSLFLLLNILKDNEFKPFHTESIDQEIITILREIQKKGNKTVHNIVRQIDRDYMELWEEKIDRTLQNLLILYRNLPKENILIDDESRMEKIKKVLNLPESMFKNKGQIKKEQNGQSKSRITEIISHIIEIIDGRTTLTKGKLITFLREIGKSYFLENLNLDYIDQGNMVILRNDEFDVRFFSPSIQKTYNFYIIKRDLNGNNVYRNNPEDPGNMDVKIQFTTYLKKLGNSI